MTSKKTLTVELDTQTAAWLAELARCTGHDDAEAVLRVLAQSAVAGCRRPGSWEWSWVRSAFFFFKMLREPELPEGPA